MPTRFLLGMLLVFLAIPAPAQVVINEILYHAPDELDDLQYVELFNAGNQAVDLGGWTLSKALRFTFRPGTVIEPRGFVVVCRDTKRFHEFYPVPVAGEFPARISHTRLRIDLADAAGRLVDTVKIKDHGLRPEGPEGYSASLERISPFVSGEDPGNWTGSPLSPDRLKPGGTPGKPNAAFSPQMPPVVTATKFAPEFPQQNEPVSVEAVVRGDAPAEQLNLLYRLAGPGFEKPETKISMTRGDNGRYTATIPGQAADQLIRFRVEAVGREGARRYFPAETEPRPAFSAYVAGAFTPAKAALGWLIHTSEKEMKEAVNRPDQPMFTGAPPDPKEQARGEARFLMMRGLDLSPLWMQLATEIAGEDPGSVAKLRTVMKEKLAERKKFVETTVASETVEEDAPKIPEKISQFMAGVRAGFKPLLTASQDEALRIWMAEHAQEKQGMERMIAARLDLEGAFHAVTLNADLDAKRWGELRKAMAELSRQRAKFSAGMLSAANSQAGFPERLKQLEEFRARIVTTLQPRLTEAQTGQLAFWRQAPRELVVGLFELPPGVVFGGFGGPGPGGPGGPVTVIRADGPGPGPGPGGPDVPMLLGPAPGGPVPDGSRALGEPTPTTKHLESHQSAFVFFDPAVGKLELFDFVQITSRKAGQKVHFEKDKPFHGMTTAGFIFKGYTESVVERLAYELYHRAGLPSEQCMTTRLTQDGKTLGYFVMVEQPNREFLRRNRIEDRGNLYKLEWFGQGLIGQHEKHTNRHQGHEDLIELVDSLAKTPPAKQWDLIRWRFDVDEVANYFAANMVLSHWDGFFNNYFAYDDTVGTGKWMMFPWDEDSTWGLRDLPDDKVFYTMALTFGMNGDREPGDGTPWRPPGWFSGPLLANPGFRDVFLRRTKQILETVFNEEVFNPVINKLEEELEPEVRLRAEIEHADPKEAVRKLKSDIARCRMHVKLRREFLLKQPELKRLGTTRPALP